jgi:hypothetical protein
MHPCQKYGTHQILISSNSDSLLDGDIPTTNPHLSHLLGQRLGRKCLKSVVRCQLHKLQPSLEIRM